MPIIRHDLHTHTIFSDGAHDPLDVVMAAIQAGLAGVGISDHFFTDKIDSSFSSVASWMKHVFPRYLHTGNWLKQKFAGKIKIWLGLEVDSCYRRIGVSLDEIPWQELATLDYLFLEYVGETSRGGMPLSDLALVRRYWSGPLILAHPDLVVIRQTLPFTEVSAIVREHNVALELSGGSRNRWPWRSCDSAQLAQVWLTMGSDMHRDLSEVGAIDRPLAFLMRNGLTHRVVDPDSLAGGSV